MVTLTAGQSNPLLGPSEKRVGVLFAGSLGSGGAMTVKNIPPINNKDGFGVPQNASNEIWTREQFGDLICGPWYCWAGSTGDMICVIEILEV
jgi:hypothetical protein